MKWISYWKSLLTIAAIVVIFFVLVSLLDLGISLIYKGAYARPAFIVSYGIGGMFAAVFGYFYGLKLAPVLNETTRWVLIVFMIIIGLTLYFFISRQDNYAYEPAFKAFGATLVLGSLLFATGKIDT